MLPLPLFRLGQLLFEKTVGKAALAAALVAALAGSFALHVRHQRQLGAERAVTKMEKKNAEAAHRGKRAADRARDDGVRGQRDPWTRAEQ